MKFRISDLLLLIFFFFFKKQAPAEWIHWKVHLGLSCVLICQNVFKQNLFTSPFVPSLSLSASVHLWAACHKNSNFIIIWVIESWDTTYFEWRQARCGLWLTFSRSLSKERRRQSGREFLTFFFSPQKYRCSTWQGINLTISSAISFLLFFIAKALILR